MNTETKSPITREPLRMPGQSLAEQVDELADMQIVQPIAMAGLLFILAGLEWLRWCWPMSKPHPVFFTMVAAIGAGWAVYKVRKALATAKNLNLGRRGEVAVGQFLERFRGGHFVFHDIPTGDANIDHVLIGAKGVFSLETKTLRKPVRGECRIRYKDGELYANGAKLTRNPMVQAKAQAGWLKQLFGEHEFKAPIQPVVLVPGWYVERFDQRAAGVWVLEPKALEAFLANEPDRLSAEEVRALSMGLSEYIRSKALI